MRRAIWYFTEPDTHGVHAVVLTPERRLVLVALSYEDGWRLPGGGRGRDEPAEAAMLRELREEIGLTAYGELIRVSDFSLRVDHKRDHSVLFVVRDVEYRPRWTLEVADVREFDPHLLPDDAAPITRRMIAAAAGLI